MVIYTSRCSSQIQKVHRLHLTPRNSLRGKKYTKFLYPKLNIAENLDEEYWSSKTLGTVCQPQVDQIGIFGEICSPLPLGRVVINNYTHTLTNTEFKWNYLNTHQ